MSLWKTTKPLHYASLATGCTYLIFDEATNSYRKIVTLKIITLVLHSITVAFLIKFNVSSTLEILKGELSLRSALKIADGFLWIVMNVVAILQIFLTRDSLINMLNDIIQMEQRYKNFLICNQNLSEFKVKLPFVLTALLMAIGLSTFMLLYSTFHTAFLSIFISISIVRTQIIFYNETSQFLQFQLYFERLNLNIVEYGLMLNIYHAINLFEKLFDMLTRLSRAYEALKLISLCAVILQISKYVFGIFEFDNFVVMENMTPLHGGLSMALSLLCCGLVMTPCYFWGSALQEVSTFYRTYSGNVSLNLLLPV